MRLRLALCSFVFVTLTHFVSAQTVMVSNLGSSIVGSSTVDEDDWWAGSFTTGASASSFALNAVELKIGAVSNTSGNFFVAIYSNSGALPGSQIGSSLSGASNPTGGNTNNSYTASGITLLASSTYWVVAGVSTGNGSYEWDFANGTTTSTWTLNAFDTKSIDEAGTWAGPFTSPLMFNVSASAIPEPSAIAALLGLSAIGFVAWSRRRRCV